MPIHSLIVIGSFSLLGLSLLILGFLLRGTTHGFLGKPPIYKVYFLSGKVALFTSWILFILKAIFPKIGYIDVPPLLSWIAAVFMFLGALIMGCSFFALGVSLKVGLPDEETVLKTGGIYRFSRNPLYLGVFMVSIASCLYFPDLFNIACALYGMIIHHFITIGEEKFLEQRFGKKLDNLQGKGQTLPVRR